MAHVQLAASLAGGCTGASEALGAVRPEACVRDGDPNLCSLSASACSFWVRLTDCGAVGTWSAFPLEEIWTAFLVVGTLSACFCAVSADGAQEEKQCAVCGWAGLPECC